MGNGLKVKLNLNNILGFMKLVWASNERSPIVYRIIVLGHALTSLIRYLEYFFIMLHLLSLYCSFP
jgi:hypothetical protein